LVAVFFLFLDRPIATLAHGLRGGALLALAQFISLVADHDWFNVWLCVGLLTGGALALGRGLTPGVRALLFVCVAVALTMMLGDTLKWCLGRYRPVMHFDHDLYGFSWFAAKGKMHSFPSGHTFRIFSAMTALALVWPRARVLLLGFAVLVGVSRVVVTCHYPSDIIAGAFVGVFCALWVGSITGWGKPAFLSKT
ncbi:MAG: phosphatase PAP2 family protein, partial [Desulfarculus sp.]|nr:phosphatase PAP2 family protein [Pseudomonadota bacterium]MBV1751088.1 phosphatase PAP2 family protein [Desulfarculus sp.]